MNELKQILYEFTATISGALIAMFVFACIFNMTGMEWPW